MAALIRTLADVGSLVRFVVSVLLCGLGGVAASNATDTDLEVVKERKTSRTHRQRVAVDRRSNLSYEEFAREYLYPLKPVIITDALQSWPAMRRWTPEFFKNEFGDMKFSINASEYGQASFDANRADEFTMAGFIDRVLESTESRPAPYFRNKVLYDLFPTLKQDIEPLPQYFQPNWLTDHYVVKRVGDVLNRGAAIELYIGGKGASFPVLHFDGAGTHAFLMQIYGRKEYIVYPPDQEPFLYPSPTKRNHSQVSDIENPNLQKFPEFGKAVPTKFFLEPGELLFVPSHWWHTARILSPSITVSINVLNQSNWRELVQYVALQQRDATRAWGSRVYLTGAGGLRFWRDRKWQQVVRGATV